MIYSITITVTAKKSKRCPGCLALAVIGMFYSVGANRGQLFYVWAGFRGSDIFGVRIAVQRGVPSDPLLV